jgi:hypothetical protein
MLAMRIIVTALVALGVGMVCGVCGWHASRAYQNEHWRACTFWSVLFANVLTLAVSCTVILWVPGEWW